MRLLTEIEQAVAAIDVDGYLSSGVLSMLLLDAAGTFQTSSVFFGRGTV